jgi:hypothetical protein
MITRYLRDCQVGVNQMNNIENQDEIMTRRGRWTTFADKIQLYLQI